MGDIPENFLLLNTQKTKRVSIVVTIDGLSTKLSNRPTYSEILYGDPDIVYGLPGLVYGGLRRLDTVRDYLSLDGSSLSLSQRLEPEQGKGAVSTLTLAFIDKDQFMTRVISPGVLLDEILGKEITVEMGYEELSYPDDYFVIFRGFISSVEARAGLVVLQLSDSNVKRRQMLFYGATTQLAAGISNVDVNIPVVAAGDFHQQILGPDGTYDSAIKTFIKVEDEFIEYPPTGISGNNFVGVTRGARGTTAVAHDPGTDVQAYIEIQDHCIDMALKLMLSGWGGPWLTGALLSSFVDNGLAMVANAIVFPVGINVVRDYGLVAGDQIITTGATNPANNVTRNIVSIEDVGDNENRMIVVDGPALVAETLTPATISFRSQFDTYPFTCGLKLTPRDVDVQGHIDLKNTFLGSSENSYRFLISEQQNGKNFIEMEIYLPVSAYSVTRRGLLSVRMTKAALAGQTLLILDQDNILNAPQIAPKRAVNTRKFFNDIVFQYDQNDDGTYLSTYRVLDSDSLNIIGMASTLPINSSGIKSDIASDTPALIQRRAEFLLSRYKRGAVEIQVRVNFEVGVQIEAGDVVALDGTGLFITNFDTGDRDFGVQLFEVVNRTIDLRTGVIDLTLISGVGAQLTDRFATISPSSKIVAGSTDSLIEIEDSFSTANPIFPGDEPQKWEDYVGERVAVHSEDFSVYEETTFVSFVPGNPYKMVLNPPLSFTPPAGYILDIPRYPTTEFKIDDAIYKAVHTHINPTVEVVTGVSATEFTVDPGDVSKFIPGQYILIHDASFSVLSPEVVIDTVVGVNVTVKSSLGFTPSVGQLIELIGFADKGGAYRII